MGNSNFLDDIAKFGNSALSEADKMQRQVRRWAGDQVGDLVDSMDIVTQEELDEITAKYEKQISELEKRLDALEGKKPVAAKATKKKAAPKKPAAKKTATKKAS